MSFGELPHVPAGEVLTKWVSGDEYTMYQHATRDRDQAIAKALGTFAKEARGTKEEPPEAPEPA